MWPRALPLSNLSPAPLPLALCPCHSGFLPAPCHLGDFAVLLPLTRMLFPLLLLVDSHPRSRFQLTEPLLSEPISTPTQSAP